MACDLKPSIDRMTEKLHSIQHLAFQGLGMAEERITLGQKWMDLATAIGKISVLVRDNSNVEHYWYAKFVERGVLVQPKNRGRDVPVASDKEGSSSDDATRTSRPLGKVVR